RGSERSRRGRWRSWDATRTTVPTQTGPETRTMDCHGPRADTRSVPTQHEHLDRGTSVGRFRSAPGPLAEASGSRSGAAGWLGLAEDLPDDPDDGSDNLIDDAGLHQPVH